ncbi:MAG: DUF2029 domain-containing protein [Anaerolineaceae bacterium]|nr:DUF2029 domain-containing protein [Anaerolineaceae bacterium]
MKSLLNKINNSKYKWLIYICLIVVILGFLLYIAITIVDNRDYLNSDFFTFYLSGHMVWTGENPYSVNDWVAGHQQFGVSWIPNKQYVYPLPLSFFYAPLGAIPYHEAYILWVFLSEVMIITSALTLLYQNADQNLKHYIFPIFVAIPLFRPTISVLFGGQIGAFLLFILTIVVVLWNKEKWFYGGMLLTIIALKPNIGVPIVCYTLFWLLLRKKGYGILGISLSGLLLLTLGFLRNVNWLSEYWEIGNAKIEHIFGYAPTIWGAFAYLTNYNWERALNWGGITVLIFILVTLVFILKNASNIAPEWMFSIAIASSLLVTPSNWPYDQVILILPIINIVRRMISNKMPYLLTALAFLFIDIIALILLSMAYNIHREIPNVIIPLIIFFVILFSKNKKIYFAQKNETSTG